MTQTLTVPLEIKSLSGREFEGYGSTFGNVDFGGDVVVPGAFKTSLAQYKNDNSLPPMFWMHQADQVPGKWLSMEEDDKGLYVKGILANTQLGNEVHTLLKMDAVKGMSIGYITREADYTNDGVRLLKQIDLIENSIVSLPMNPKAQVQYVKTRLSANGEYVPPEDELAEIKRDCEDFLRRKGFSRRAAMAGVADFFKGFSCVTPDSSDAETDRVTPDVIELRYASNDFNDRMVALDLAKLTRRYFNG